MSIQVKNIEKHFGAFHALNKKEKEFCLEFIKLKQKIVSG
jgi:hypothetical protein